MAIDDLQGLTAAVTAVSLATERLVTVAKTAAPTFFAEEQKTEAKEVDLVADKWRRFRVLGVALAAAWITTGLVADASAGASLLEFHPLGKLTLSGRSYAVPFIAILSTGGSAFWAQLVGYLSALKDVQQTTKAADSLAFQAQAVDMGLTPRDSGVVARSSPAAVPQKRSSLLDALHTSPPAFPAAQL